MEIDEELIKALNAGRITTLRKFTNMTTSFLDSIAQKVEYDAIDVDINMIKRFLPAHHFLMITLKKFPKYEDTTIKEIDEMIVQFEDKGSQSIAMSPLQMEERSIVPTNQNIAKRVLTPF